MTNCFCVTPSRKARRTSPGKKCNGTDAQKNAPVSLPWRIAITQAGWQAIRPLARIVFEFIAKMLRVVRIFLALGIRIRNRRVARQRLDAESVCGVEIEILLEAVCIKEIIAHPSRGKSGQLARIEIQ